MVPVSFNSVGWFLWLTALGMPIKLAVFLGWLGKTGRARASRSYLLAEGVTMMVYWRRNLDVLRALSLSTWLTEPRRSGDRIGGLDSARPDGDTGPKSLWSRLAFLAVGGLLFSVAPFNGSTNFWFSATPLLFSLFIFATVVDSNAFWLL